jgi:MFS family permease
MAKLNKDQLIVFIGTILFQIGVGIYSNAAGTLFAAMRLAENYPVAYMSMYYGIRGIGMAVFAIIAVPQFFKVKSKISYLVLVEIVSIASFMIFLFGTGRTIWIIAAVLVAFGFCCLGITTPYILNQWMPGFAGTATGVAMACYGVAGAIFNPLVSSWSKAGGWKSANIKMALFTAALCAIGLIMIFRKPIPNDTRTSGGQSGLRVVIEDKKLFALVTLGTLASSCTYMFSQYMGTYATDLGYDLSVGATMSTLSNIGNIAWKIVFGIACDRIGPHKPILFTLWVTVLTFGGFAFLNGSQLALYASAFLYSMCFSAGAIGFSRLCMSSYDVEGYKKYSPLHSCINSLAGALYSFSAGPMITRMGNYNYLFIACTVLIIISTAAITQLLKRLNP